MTNNFFVGIIYHSKRNFKQEYQEKTVLYTEDNLNFLDLKSQIIYTTNTLEKNYVIKESLIPTDISEYKEDYFYLLEKYKTRVVKRKK